MKEPVLWPAAMGDWKISEGPTGYDPDTTFKYMNGAAELFRAYNMKNLNVLRYEKQGRSSITTEIFRMSSAENAYGLFTFENDDPEAGIGQGSTFGGGLLRFWKGPYFVSVYGDSAGKEIEAATLHIGRHIAVSIAETGKPPGIMDRLPVGGPPYSRKQSWFLHSHILLNQRFFISHANILNLSGETDVFLAQYGSEKGKLHLLLVKYPTETHADGALMEFRRAYMPDASGKSSVKTENNRWTVLNKSGRFVIIVFDAPDEALAMRLIKATDTALSKEDR
ncbi:MAG: hypothetical protein C0392_01445 [Syntrophus sp. (in: bacteria)]|nr:hypothetical protein [Syntrophus sp. (in: bacteria)]